MASHDTDSTAEHDTTSADAPVPETTDSEVHHSDPEQDDPASRPAPPASPGTNIAQHGTVIWIGAALATAGIGLIFFTWHQIAFMAYVPLQLPYVTGGALGGLVFVIAGAVAISTAVRRAESKRRSKEMAEVTRSLRECREMLEEPESRQEPDSGPAGNGA